MAKVLRIDILQTEALLEMNPRLKVVHLFRDPRSIINSHIVTDWFPVKSEKSIVSLTLQQDIQITCKRIRYDIAAGHGLMNKYPGRVRFIQYEDFIDDIENKVKKLYDYLGMKYDSELEEFINTTSHIQKDTFTKVPVGTLAYRRTLQWEVVNFVDRSCKDVLETLGYKIFTSKQQLESDEFSPLTNPLPYSL